MKHLFLSVIILIAIGCASNRRNNIYEYLDYKSPSRCANIEGLGYIYVVDTIEIKEALVIKTISGNKFVMSKFIYDQYYDGSNEFLIQCPDVYIFEDDYMPSCVDSYNRAGYSNNTCGIYEGFVPSNIDKKKNIKSCINDERKNKDYVILLIMGRYYNHSYTLAYNSRLNFGSNKFNYYKLAIPLYKERYRRYKPQEEKKVFPLPPGSLLAE